MLKYLRMGNKRTKAIWWALIVLTVGTFVGGFIFLFGMGFDAGTQAQISGALGTVDGESITRPEFQNALVEQQAAYRQQYKSEPADQDARMVEAQAWRSLVIQRLIDRKARKLGLKATDREVLLSLKSSPPQMLAAAPDFQTDGKFDPAKYAAALRNPGINWAPFENLVREQLPTRKLQERLISSIKLSQPELATAYRNQFEKVALTVVQVPPSTESNLAEPSEADLTRVYEQYKGRFSGGERVQLELLQVPKQYSVEELRVAREQARTLVDRARRGEDFASLARDYSEGAGADRGGEINRAFQPSEFGPQLGPKMAAMQIGDISDPVEEQGRLTIFKVVNRIQDPMAPMPSLQVAQIVIKVRPGESSLQQQHQEMQKLRDRAERIGLGKAAAEKGLATAKTQFFQTSSTPTQLNSVPQVTDWAIGAKAGEIGPVFEGSEDFTLTQLADRRPAGPPPRADLAEQLKPIAEAETRVAAARPRADQLIKALADQSLEDAARATGLTSFKTEGMSRQQPDPRLGSSPEAVGAAFAARPGQIVGPIQSLSGWFIVRVDAKIPADSLAFDQLKGQISSNILSRKQQEFFAAWVTEQRLKAKVRDLRFAQ